jgi:hypothetical protein
LVRASDSELFFELSPDSLNIDVSSEHHSHELTITVGANGTLQHDWLNWSIGVPAESIELSRVE